MRLGEIYTVKQFEKLCEGLLDEASADAVFNEFLTRYPVEGETFTTADGQIVNGWAVHFRNDLMMYGKNYVSMLRAETTKIDPMVSDYMERWVKDSTTFSEEGGGKTTTENSGSHENSGNTGGSNDTNYEGSYDNNATGKTTSKNDNRSMVSNLPMSLSYGGTTENDRSSLIPQLNWQSASNQSENDGKSQDDNETHDNGWDTNKTHSEYGGVSSDNGWTKFDGVVTDATNRKGNNAYEHKERYSGRHEAPQDMLERAYNYFRTTNALKWLCDKLDRNFTRIVEW